MVSLKSFKPINEGERDEELNNSDQVKDQLQLQRHHITNQLPSHLPSGTANNKTTARGEPEAHFNNNKSLHHHHRHRHQIIDNHERSSINENITKSSHDVKLNPTKMSTQATNEEDTIEFSNGSSMSATLDNRSEAKKRQGNNKNVIKVALKSRVEGDNNETRAHIAQKGSQGKNVERDCAEAGSPSPSSSSISIVVVQHDNPSSSRQTTSDSDYAQDESSNQSLDDLDEAHPDNRHKENLPSSMIRVPVVTDASYFNTNGLTKDNILSGDMHMYQRVVGTKGLGSGLPNAVIDTRLSTSLSGDHFEIVWSNLSYRIEPKWYKKIDFLDRLFSHFLPGQTIDNHSSATSTASSSAGMNDNQHQMHTSANADSHLQNTLNSKQKSSLDPLEIFTNLNGTIKSGQMTAVLGPSGKFLLLFSFAFILSRASDDITRIKPVYTSVLNLARVDT